MQLPQLRYFLLGLAFLLPNRFANAQNGICAEIFDTPASAVAPALEDAWNQALNAVFEDTKIPDKDIGWFCYSDPSGTPARPSLSGPVYQEELADGIHTPFVLPIELAYRFGGGAILLANDVYPNEYFKLRYSDHVPVDRSASALRKWWKKLNDTIPWLEWDAAKHEFQLRKGGAQERIFERMFARKQTIQLYRGTTLFEALALDFLTHLRSEEMTLAQLVEHAERLVDSYREMLKRLKVRARKNKAERTNLAAAENIFIDLTKLLDSLQQLQTLQASTREVTQASVEKILQTVFAKNAFGAVFTTTDQVAAKSFSKGAVLTFAVPGTTMSELHRAGLLYIGFEGTTELAFITESGAAQLIRSFKSFEPEEVSLIWK